MYCNIDKGINSVISNQINILETYLQLSCHLWPVSVSLLRHIHLSCTSRFFFSYVFWIAHFSIRNPIQAMCQNIKSFTLHVGFPFNIVNPTYYEDVTCSQKFKILAIFVAYWFYTIFMLKYGHFLTSMTNIPLSEKKKV